MGEARRRGTFEERKAQAIAEGRVKQTTLSRIHSKVNPSWDVFVKAMSQSVRKAS